MASFSSTVDFDRYRRLSSALGVADYSSRLIHYTSLQTLECVLRSRELWFGRLCDLNDSAEGNHFLDAVIEQTPKLILGSDLGGLVALLPQVRRAIKEGTFVSSWCEYFDAEPNGRLSMWRAYAPNGAGVGLVVDASQFLPSAMTPAKIGFHVMATKVDYVAPNRAVDLANDYFRRLASVDFVRATIEDKMVMANLLAIKAPCVKHDGFSEEEEIRFLYMPDLQQLFGRPRPPGSIRTGPTGRRVYAFPLQQYVEHDLDLRLETLLRRVVVGPGNNQPGRAAAVRGLLREHGLEGVEVHSSTIPLAA
jgi:hypothetical protein